MTKFLTFENISVCYKDKEVLNSINFEIEKGTILFLLGNNGSGKTTLLKTFMRMVPIKNGDVFIEGINISKINQLEFSKIVSYVPQNINLSCDLSVKDYLILGRNPYIKFNSPKNKDYEIIEEYASKMNILDLLDKSFTTLSGGQKQLVTITRALAQETPILAMDEPMSALDLGKQAEVLMTLKRLNKEFGKTVILTTHNPNHCFHLNSKVCILNETKLVGIDSAEQILNESNINKIYGEYIKINKGRIDFCI